MKFNIYKKSRDEIQAIQLKKMQRIVEEAYRKSSFYHDLYKNSDFHPEMLKTYEDIIYMSSKGGGFEKQIQKMASKPETKNKAIKELVADSNEEKATEIEKEINGEEMAEDDKEGMTVEEAAVVTGISTEILDNFVNENGKILGIRTTDDVETLSKQMGEEINITGTEVVLLKVVGPTGKDQGFVLDKEGNNLLSPDVADTTLVTELVRDGANGDNISSINDAIRTTCIQQEMKLFLSCIHCNNRQI